MTLACILEKFSLSGVLFTVWVVLYRQKYDGPHFHLGNLRVLRDRNRIRMGVHALMTPWELVLGSIMALGLTVYLVYAMLRPEKF